jgi:peptidoglycan hydrolase CwlO-like protein
MAIDNYKKQVLQSQIDKLNADILKIQSKAKKDKKTGAYSTGAQRQISNLQMEIERARSWMKACEEGSK